MSDLLGQLGCLRWRVVVGDTDQGQHTVFDLANYFAVDPHPGFRHSLHQRSHRPSLSTAVKAQRGKGSGGEGEEGDGAGFVEGFVAVAALWRHHT